MSAQYTREPISVQLPTRYPAFNICTFSPANGALRSLILNGILDPSVYPELVIYPPVSAGQLSTPAWPSFLYPNIVIYPSVNGTTRSPSAVPRSIAPISTRLHSAYPYFDICTFAFTLHWAPHADMLVDPAGYPINLYNIYPPVALDNVDPLSVKLSVHYPVMEICTWLCFTCQTQVLTQ